MFKYGWDKTLTTKIANAEAKKIFGSSFLELFISLFFGISGGDLT
jgi:hypothetical protein